MFGPQFRRRQDSRGAAKVEVRGRVALLACLLLASTGGALADPAQDFDRIIAQSRKEQADGKFQEMEQTAEQLRRLAEGPLRRQPVYLAAAMNQRAVALHFQGRYAEAEPLLQRGLAIVEAEFGAEHSYVATWISNAASIYLEQGRYAEAESYNRRALAIRAKAFGPEHPDVAVSLNNLALVYQNAGRFAEALPLCRQAVAILEKATDAQLPALATMLNNLAEIYDAQGRYGDAEPIQRRALAIRQKVLAPDHPDVAQSLGNLALLYCGQNRYADAERLHRQALAIRQKALRPTHPDVAVSLDHLARVLHKSGRHAEAEPLERRALAIRLEVLGPENPVVARSLYHLADVLRSQGRQGEAVPLLDQAIGVLERSRGFPIIAFSSCHLRAKLAWEAQRRPEAIADLRRALDLAEQLRGRGSGAEQERAEFFSGFASAFETMVAWQTELGDAGEVLTAMERSRARSLLDQIQSAGTDLLAGLPAAQADQLRRNEAKAQQRVRSLERQLEFLQRRADLSAEQRQAQEQDLLARLRQARQEYAQAYADIRNASPAYRLAVGKDLKAIRLQELQRWVAEREAMLVEYLLGEEESYVLIVSSDGKPRVEKLAIAPEHAPALGIKAGPLTRKRLTQILGNDEGAGLLQRLRNAADAEAAKQVRPGLAALWRLLLPESERQAVVAGKYKRLAVVPDGALAQLPFEVLVVGTGSKAEHLLDVGPPILYAPSATILVNLAQRQADRKSPAAEPVLTVGEPLYGEPASGAGESPMAQLAPRWRYGGAGGRLQPLPFTAWETRWVGEVFGEQGIEAAQLRGALATEAAVRHNASGRRILHLACHGLVDQAHGNLFGALALTPGADANDPADDGFLTLAEVYQLKVQASELTILSACETNYGPEQRGEGVWALSRGFLVAGSRRVVASNWLVDDQAAASLVSYFCSHLAAAEKKGQAPDYAQALQAAKRWVRAQENWASPYFWGTFVLLGPN